jgi:hypothetical protein
MNIIVWIIGVIGAIAAVGTVVLGLWPEKEDKADPMELDQSEWNHYQQYGEPK